jgi:hypothetical protein
VLLGDVADVQQLGALHRHREPLGEATATSCSSVRSPSPPPRSVTSTSSAITRPATSSGDHFGDWGVPFSECPISVVSALVRQSVPKVGVTMTRQLREVTTAAAAIGDHRERGDHERGDHEIRDSTNSAPAARRPPHPEPLTAACRAPGDARPTSSAASSATTATASNSLRKGR